MAVRTETIVWGNAPPGAIVDHAVLVVTGALGSVQTIDIPMGANSVDILLVPDVYTATVQAVDAALNPIGASVTDTFVIMTPVIFSIPVSMSGTTV
jgi:hypothetical protein